jgi:hypothetical protein
LNLQSDEVREAVKSFNSYVDELRDDLIDEAGKNADGKVSEEDYIMFPMANECLKERKIKM